VTTIRPADAPARSVPTPADGLLEGAGHRSTRSSRPGPATTCTDSGRPRCTPTGTTAAGQVGEVPRCGEGVGGQVRGDVQRPRPVVPADRLRGCARERRGDEHVVLVEERRAPLAPPSGLLVVHLQRRAQAPPRTRVRAGPRLQPRHVAAEGVDVLGGALGPAGQQGRDQRGVVGRVGVGDVVSEVAQHSTRVDGVLLDPRASDHRARRRRLPGDRDPQTRRHGELAKVLGARQHVHGQREVLHGGRDRPVAGHAEPVVAAVDHHRHQVGARLDPHATGRCRQGCVPTRARRWPTRSAPPRRRPRRRSHPTSHRRCVWGPRG
jgi:hypothetical protein